MPLIKQPNSAHCFVCGLRNPLGLKVSFYAASATEVVATYTPPADYEGFPGVLHGGIVAALLDEAGGRVVMIVDHNHFMMTARLNIKYRRPTPMGQPLTVLGRLVQQRGRIATSTAELRLADGTVTAEAELTLADLPGPEYSAADREALGWKVYPDADTPTAASGVALESSAHD